MEPDPVRLHVTATHGNAMLTRLTALLGQHDVDYFSYRVGGDGRVHAEVDVHGGAWQVARVAARLDRLVGVVEVQATERAACAEVGAGVGKV